MHSHNLCTGAYHLTKFLGLGSVPRSSLYFQILTFHLYFWSETVIDLDQHNNLVPCMLA